MIELIAVMVVVGVLAAVAAPSFSGLDDRRSVMGARLLLRDMTFARQHAVATGTPTWVVVNVAGDSWSLLVEDPSNLGRAGATAMVEPGTGEPWVRTMGADAFATVGIASANFDGDPEVGFDWLGRPLDTNENDLAADGVVTFDGGETVTVRPETGHATFSP